MKFVSFRSVFFGDISPKDRPEFYIKCINNVYQTYADHYRNKIPLIVNTQGWVKGEECQSASHKREMMMNCTVVTTTID